MDVIGLLNDITGGNLLLWKVIAATIVLLLAGFQVFLAARFFQASTFPRMTPERAASLHRWSGRTALVLATLVGLSCLAGPAGAISPTRAVFHSIFGGLVFIVLAVKFWLLRIAKAGDRFLPVIGSLVFLAFGGIWATSVADYVAR